MIRWKIMIIQWNLNENRDNNKMAQKEWDKYLDEPMTSFGTDWRPLIYPEF